MSALVPKRNVAAAGMVSSHDGGGCGIAEQPKELDLPVYF
jgi:hypothetical protein